jgi:hypothetical protein
MPGRLFGAVVVIMLVLALVLSLITSMAGSSRTLYQASVDGWLPKYLSKVNSTPCAVQRHAHRPVLQPYAAADVRFGVRHRRRQRGLHDFQFPQFECRLDSSPGPPAQERPWRAPNWVLAVGAALSFVNLAFMGFGADVYGVGT